MTADDFAAQARKLFNDAYQYGLEIDDHESHIDTVNVALNDLTRKLVALHQAELERAEDALLDRVEEEVIGADYIIPETDNMTLKAAYATINDCKVDQRQRLDTLRSKGRP